MLVYWGLSVGIAQDLLCPPTAEGDCCARFARRDARSKETEVGAFDNGNAHAGIDKSTNFGAGFLPLLGEPE